MILTFKLRLVMDIKTKRIVIQSLKNLSKLVSFSIAVIAYTLLCFWISHILSGDIYFGLAALVFPMLLFSVWDISRSQVESQIYNEEQLLDMLSRKTFDQQEPRI